MKEERELKEAIEKRNKILSKATKITNETKQSLSRLNKRIAELQFFVNAKPRTDK